MYVCVELDVVWDVKKYSNIYLYALLLYNMHILLKNGTLSLTHLTCLSINVCIIFSNGKLILFSTTKVNFYVSLA
jgi:hypothetical protein